MAYTNKINLYRYDLYLSIIKHIENNFTWVLVVQTLCSMVEFRHKVNNFLSSTTLSLLSGAAVIRYKDPAGCLVKIQFSILPPVITFWPSRNEGSFRPQSLVYFHLLYLTVTITQCTSAIVLV